LTRITSQVTASRKTSTAQPNHISAELTLAIIARRSVPASSLFGRLTIRGGSPSMIGQDGKAGRHHQNEPLQSEEERLGRPAVGPARAVEVRGHMVRQLRVIRDRQRERPQHQ
jgi:hypothetical protein